MSDIKYRIGVGNEVDDIQDDIIVEPTILFTADSTLIFSDSTIRHADETK